MNARAKPFLSLLISLAIPTTAYAAKAGDCRLASNVLQSRRLADLPKPISTDFHVHIGRDIAEFGKDFNDSDMLDGISPTRRIVEIRHFEKRWVVIYEHGGLGPHIHIVAYTLTESGKEASLVANIMENLDDVPCTDIDGWLIKGTSLSPEIASEW